MKNFYEEYGKDTKKEKTQQDFDELHLNNHPNIETVKVNFDAVSICFTGLYAWEAAYSTLLKFNLRADCLHVGGNEILIDSEKEIEKFYNICKSKQFLITFENKYNEIKSNIGNQEERYTNWKKGV